MRSLVQPPPSTHCDLCGAELRLKLVEPANRILDLDKQIFVCAKCGRELSRIVDHDKYTAHTTADMPHTNGLTSTSTSTRTVIIQPAPSIAPTDAASTTTATTQ